MWPKKNGGKGEASMNGGPGPETEEAPEDTRADLHKQCEATSAALAQVKSFGAVQKVAALPK
eukprot:7311756-Prorocentrum_lima.AAC.1